MALRVLLIDDDRDFVRHFAALAAGTFNLSTAHTYQDGLAKVRRGAIDAVLLDIDLQEDRTGLDLLAEIRVSDPDLPVIMLSNDERPETIDRAIRAGAEGYTPKHCNLGVLRTRIEHNLENVMWRHHARALETGPMELTGSGPRLQALRREIAEVAGTSVRVLIRGESGSGKELVAHAIHAAGARRHGRFVTVNGAIGTEELFDSLIFGHERGSYTGADKARVGKLELAQNGTLFLDEVGKMSPARQAKLLRVIEEGAFERLGGDGPVPIDTRFICASNENLEQALAQGRCYPDFYYRIRDYEITVPPLRERLEDLGEIARALADRFCEREARPRAEFADDALDACRAYRWPGNIRELDSVLKRAIISAPGLVTRAAVQSALDRVRLDPDGEDGAPVRLEEAHAAWERAFIGRALARCGGNVERTAQDLGVSRSTLYARLQTHGLMARREGRDPGRE